MEKKLKTYIPKSLYNDFVNLIEHQTEKPIEDDANSYLIGFCTSSQIEKSESNELYYVAWMMYIRWVPTWIILKYINRRTSKHFDNTNAPESVRSAHQAISKKIVQNAFRNYCKRKIKDFQ